MNVEHQTPNIDLLNGIFYFFLKLDIQYIFSIHASSKRCKFIPDKNDICPGNIRECSFCQSKNDYYQSGGSTFTVDFKIPQAQESSNLKSKLPSPGF